ncbi:aminopeptidase G [Georgenia soli]|uniref:Aminopeptidase N n=1 Tax=Georgenia soli TaxID=638953 RepID=A0A2A9EHI5_9MICO|nr:aminopeptidase N [Georgenia soli]PFG38076.1 aminopeptidase G [Georgenia soli]
MTTTANLTRAEAAERSDRLTVHDYHVELDLSRARDLGSPTFGSTTTVRFAATAPTTFLDFLGHVRSVVVNGREVDPAACYDGARITLEGLEAENEVTVVADALYSRSGEGMHRFVDPADGETYLYTQYEPADSRRVMAVFEQPDLKARFAFAVVAPSGWQVLSNQPAFAAAGRADGTVRTEFATTPPLSSFLTAVVAGPYHRVDGHWSGRLPDGGTLDVPLGVLCRASLAEHLDAEAILTVTRQGLDFFHEHFGTPYPWGKYDQVFVPEYNLGAMENPGCVTFTEAYVFRSAATRAQYQARANTILHEMAHMWFGDLVTPRWWDDLWLKESFADYMGAHASVAATEFTDAWVSFANRRKAWAYTQDQLPTTHPIVADIPDLEAAKQNFDGITYAKGASVLKQLVAYVGTDAFFAGARAYFAEHAYGSTSLTDLLTALEGASGRDLGEWSRLWLQTAGTPTLRAEVEADGERVRSLVVRQRGGDPRTGQEVLRPHRLAVGLYDLVEDDGGAALVRSHRFEVELTGESVAVAEAAGLPRPALVLVNDDDLTYGKVRLDPDSLSTVREHLGALREPLARSLVWSALWNATRDAVLPAADYLDLVLRHGPAETDSAVLAGLTLNAGTAVERYAPPARRDELRLLLGKGSLAHLHEAAPGSDAQLVWARSLARSAATTPAAAPRLRGLLSGSETVVGLPMDPELRWSLWQALAALGAATLDELDEELAHDRTADGTTQHLAAVSSFPDADVKAASWETLLTPGALSNDHVDATLTGFTQPWHRELTAPFTDRYFDALRGIWARHSIEIASRLVRRLYPAYQDVVPGRAPQDDPVVQRSTRWLEENADAPAALRRLVLEARDELLRSLRAQEAGLRAPEASSREGGQA